MEIDCLQGKFYFNYGGCSIRGMCERVYLDLMSDVSWSFVCFLISVGRIGAYFLSERTSNPISGVNVEVKAAKIVRWRNDRQLIFLDRRGREG